MTRGLDLNNPMNLMETSINWAYQIKPTNDPDHRLAQFRSSADGLHAGIENLLNQQLLHGLNTVRLIITKYAPPLVDGKPANDTKAYIADVCGALGCGSDDVIDLREPGTLAICATRIIIHEQGANPFTADEIMATVTSVIAYCTGKNPDVTA